MIVENTIDFLRTGQLINLPFGIEKRKVITLLGETEEQIENKESFPCRNRAIASYTNMNRTYAEIRGNGFSFVKKEIHDDDLGALAVSSVYPRQCVTLSLSKRPSQRVWLYKRLLDELR